MGAGKGGEKWRIEETEVSVCGVENRNDQKCGVKYGENRRVGERRE